jgi:hypothetical protein
MQNSVPDGLLGCYELHGSDTRNGLILLGLASFASFIFSIFSFATDQNSNGIILLLISTILSITLLFGVKRYRARICYGFTQDEFFKLESGQMATYPIKDIIEIKLTYFGAGETSTGSYKVVFKDGTVFWFHSFGRSETFVKRFASTFNMEIVE